MTDNSVKPAVAIDSLGCKLNQAEMESLSRQLKAAGYALVSPSGKADVYVLNSCTVTHIADRKTRQKLRGYHRLNQQAKIVVTGCYAERAKGELSELEGDITLVGNDGKASIPQLIENLLSHNKVLLVGSQELFEVNRRARSFIKIQDGCRNYCTYCIVPLVRSLIENVPPGRIIEEIRAREAEGFQEVVLTGTEIGQYSCGTINLATLIEKILAETGIPRIRLSSMQPPEIHLDLIKLWKNPRLCPHFHISLQSGNDSVLSRMKRRYNVDEYRRAVTLIRGKIPDVAITTDVIVGFPGETDAEFQETLEFCREMEFARIHVFPYSNRPGTTAAVMTPKVAVSVKKERSQAMLSVAEKSAMKFHSLYLGRTMDVLFEQKTGGFWTGLTVNYIRVYVHSNKALEGLVAPVRLVRVFRDGVRGTIAGTISRG